MGRLFSIQIFDHSAAFDCRNILDAEKGILEFYQKRTFIEIDTNVRKFSRTWTNSGAQFQINRLHTTFIANGDLNCYQNIMYTHFSHNY